jgi:lipid-A-disaccharide synthase
MTSQTDPSILFVAGDPSGDEHAAPVMAELKSHLPTASYFGIGGPSMQAQGLSPLLPFAEFNRMGLVEVLTHLRFFVKARKLLVAEMQRRRPRVCVCVDYPGFNLPIMRAAHRLGIPVVWYIAPKVWAWKAKRAKILGEHATAIATIFPFEPAIYKSYPAATSYVGNPLVEALQKEATRRGERLPFRLSTPQRSDANPWRIALVPGSRVQEVRRILEPMAEAVGLLRQRFPGLQARVSACAWLDEKLFSPAVEKHGLEIYQGPLYDLLSWADCALVTSGTATLQTALMGVPHVVVYRMSPLNYAVGKVVVKIPHIGLPNIIAGKEIVPECIQERATPQILAEQLLRYMTTTEGYQQAVADLGGLWDVLGTHAPSAEVAAMIAKCVK